MSDFIKKSCLTKPKNNTYIVKIHVLYTNYIIDNDLVFEKNFQGQFSFTFRRLCYLIINSTKHLFFMNNSENLYKI